MTTVYPKDAADNLRGHQRQIDSDGTFVTVSRQALDELLEWAGRYETAPLIGMQVSIIPELNEVHIFDEEVDANAVDIVNINARAFVPEAPETVEELSADEVPEMFKAGLQWAARQHREPPFLEDELADNWRMYVENKPAVVLEGGR